MKNLMITCAFAAFMISTNAQVHKPQQTQTPVHFASFNDSVSYAVGISMAKFYQRVGMDTINTTLLSRSVKTVLDNDSSALTEEQIGEVLSRAMIVYPSQKAAVNKKEGEAFLAKNKTNPDVVTLPDGMQYKILQKGTGAIPKDTNSVKVDYIGTLLNGKEIDNSYKRGKPLEFRVNSVIRGWIEILQLMPVGSKWRVWIPSDLGYGDRAAGDIPPGSTLQFDIELLEINK